MEKPPRHNTHSAQPWLPVLALSLKGCVASATFSTCTVKQVDNTLSTAPPQFSLCSKKGGDGCQN